MHASHFGALAILLLIAISGHAALALSADDASMSNISYKRSLPDDGKDGKSKAAQGSNPYKTGKCKLVRGSIPNVEHLDPKDFGPRPAGAQTVVIPNYRVTSHNDNMEPSRREPYVKRDSRSSNEASVDKRAKGDVLMESGVKLMKRSYKPPGARARDEKWTSKAPSSSGSSADSAISWKKSSASSFNSMSPASSFNAKMGSHTKAPAKYPAQDPNHAANSASSWRKNTRRSLPEDDKSSASTHGYVVSPMAVHVGQASSAKIRRSIRGAANHPSNAPSTKGLAVPITYKGTVRSDIETHNHSRNRCPLAKRSIEAVGEDVSNSSSFKKRASKKDRYNGSKANDMTFSEAVDSSYDATLHERFPILAGTSSFEHSKNDPVHYPSSPRPSDKVGVIGDRRPAKKAGGR